MRDGSRHEGRIHRPSRAATRCPCDGNATWSGHSLAEQAGGRADPASGCEDLADRHCEGRLTAAELRELESLVGRNLRVSVLRAEAQNVSINDLSSGGSYASPLANLLANPGIQGDSRGKGA